MKGYAEVLVTITITIIVVAVIVGACMLAAKASCEEVAETTGHPVRWQALSGCYIKPDAKTGWVPLDSWRTLDSD